MIPRSHKIVFGVILEPHGSSLFIFRKHENLLPDDVSVQQMAIKNAISLCWRTMPLRGLGPKGVRVGHSVCIVRQVLSRGQLISFSCPQCSRGDDTFGEGSCEDRLIFLVVFGDWELLVVAFAADGV